MADDKRHLCALRPGEWWQTQVGAPSAPPTLTILTVVRRDHTGLAQTIDSILNAGLVATELIIIEGDDRDSAPARELRSHIGQHFLSARWLLAPDRGVYDGMNKGALAATGAWLWFVNAGDLVDAGLDEVQLMARLRRATSEWLLASAWVATGDGSPTRKSAHDYSFSNLAFHGYVPCHQAVFVRRLAFARLGGFDIGMHVSADYDQFLRLAVAGDPDTWDVDVVRYRGGGLSTHRWRRRNIEAAQARARVLGQASLRARFMSRARITRRLLTPLWVHERRAQGRR